jgi:ATP-dependent helicase HrpB
MLEGIDTILPDLLAMLRTQPNVILHAPPGAGKTTRVPLALLQLFPIESGRILLLEPRRIAAVSAARWMAQSLGEQVGQTVGYSIRFDSCCSAATRIEVVTEGILTRRIQSDPLLTGIAMVIFDEFHERNIHADLGLALCLDLQRQLRDDLKMIVMSATLDVQPLARLLDNAPVISSMGRSFPVEEIYLEERAPGRVPQLMMAAVVRALHETDGDILAFLPGSGEIRNCAQLLAHSEAVANTVSVHQLYGDLPFAEQQKALVPGSRRKVVLATSIAETSLTIDGVRTVIDCGVSRRVQFDPASGLNRLVTVRESRASAEQRSGRAGRVAPGVCYRLFSRHTLSAMTPHSPAEIMETDLSALLLETAAWGMADPLQLEWLDNPPDAALTAARRLLMELGACDHAGRITATGREIVRLPLHPRLGRLLLRSRELHCLSLGCDLAALLSERDILRFERDSMPTVASWSDMADRLETLGRWRVGRSDNDRLDAGAVQSVERVVRQLRRLMGVGSSVMVADDSEDLIARLLLAAYPDRLARRRTNDTGDSYLLLTGRGAHLSQRSAVRGAEYIVAPLLDGGCQAEASIHLATAISEAIIREERADYIVHKEQVTWNEREGRIVAERQEKLGTLQLSAIPFMPGSELVVPVILAAVRASGMSLLTMSEPLRQMQGRMARVRAAFPDQSWPDISDAALRDTLEEWLAPYISDVKSARKLALLDVAALLLATLDYRQQRELEKLVPTHLIVASGSRIRLDYSAEQPVLAVKLQELFGAADGPTVCDGRIAVLLHLLSPAGRPVQVTGDLKGFWNGSYQQVKKELKGRYPKHPWPDDPWSAQPTRRLKPKGT